MTYQLCAFTRGPVVAGMISEFDDPTALGASASRLFDKATLQPPVFFTVVAAHPRPALNPSTQLSTSGSRRFVASGAQND